MTQAIQNKPLSDSCRAGFSLVELLVTMVVSSILIAALMQSFVTASDSWSSQSKHATAQREARAALRIITDDLSSAVALPSGGPLVMEPAGMRLVPTRFWTQASAEESGSTRLAFLRLSALNAPPADSGRGDLRLVLYGVSITADGGASGLEPDARSQKLVRCEFPAAETHRRLLRHRLQNQPLIREEDWKLLEQPNLPRPDPDEPVVAVLAHDLIQFNLKPLERLLEERVEPGWPETSMPTWVEVVLRVTNRQTGRWLRTLADWRGQGERARLLHNNTPDVYHDDPEVRTFAMRLRLPAQDWSDRPTSLLNPPSS